MLFTHFWIVGRRVNVTMTTKRRLHSYDEAIKALNNLQTNASVLEKVISERQKNVHLNIPLATKYFCRSAVTLDDLDRLPVIHVSGTKGKGSTCAFVEAILRKHGLKTGFFSSPHLVSVTERIRINGLPISQEMFAEYFWKVYETTAQRHDPSDRPPYFKFLTILAFNIFIKEAVDVAVIEVGIGGEYDCTNIIRKPVVCGITSLGIDHTAILGGTIGQIAWHKAGIMKPGVPAFTDDLQDPEGMEVLKRRAHEIGAPLHTAPPLHSYDWSGHSISLGLPGAVNHRNASIGLQLARSFLQRTGRMPAGQPGPFALDDRFRSGLRSCSWPGRSQTLRCKHLTYFLDGAHTIESTLACVEWFGTAARKDATKSPNEKVFRVLLFNTSRDRVAKPFLSLLQKLNFDHVVFCTNIANTASDVVTDNTNFNTTLSWQSKRCSENVKCWNKLLQERIENNRPVDGSVNPEFNHEATAIAMPCINDALAWITRGRDEKFQSKIHTMVPPPKGLMESDRIQILVTGSLHLIGGVLELIKHDFDWIGEANEEDVMEVTGQIEI